MSQGLRAKDVQDVPNRLMGSTGEMEITRRDEKEWKRMYGDTVLPPSTVQEVCLPMWRKSQVIVASTRVYVRPVLTISSPSIQFISKRHPIVSHAGNVVVKEIISTTIDQANQAVDAWRRAKQKRIFVHPLSPEVSKVRANEENA